MRTCPTCGFHNTDDRERCLKCSTLLKSTALPDGSHLADKQADRLRLDIPFNIMLSRLGQKLAGKLPDDLPPRFPWTAAYLSMFFALGQVYNHQFVKALVFIAIQLSTWAVLIATWYNPNNNYVALVVVAWMLYQMTDAFIISAKINGTPFRLKHVFAMWCAWFFFLGATLIIGQFGGHGAFRLTTIRSGNMAPAFMAGDKVFVACWPKLWGSPRRGDIVFYNPKHYSYERPGGIGGNDIISVNERNGFGVITALGGETVSWAPKEPIKVNGVEVPWSQLPLRPDGVPGTMSIPIPAGSYGILQTHPISESGLLAGLGGSYNGAVPTPHDAARQGYLLREYPQSAIAEDEEIYGYVLFRYYPPERREWFGRGNGVWTSAPPNYPAD